MRTREILDYVRDLKTTWGDDPFDIAERFGIKVNINNSGKPSAYIINMPNYPTVISIFGDISDVSRKVLCAHELGHAILHDNCVINRFTGTKDAVQNYTEYEANLFAVALLFNEEDFNRPISAMSNGMLKMILDYNIH